MKIIMNYHYQNPLLIIVWITVGSFFFGCQQPSSPSNNALVSGDLLFLGTANGDLSNGIEMIHFFRDGSFKKVAMFDSILNPSFLDLSPDRKYLIAVHSEKGEKTGRISSFMINHREVSLEYINTQNTEGNGPCYVSVDPSGVWAMAANYGSGSAAIFPIHSDGSLGEATDVVQHAGSSLNQQRQKGPHAHYIRSGIKELVFVADLGIDKVMVYEIQKETGDLLPFTTPSISVEPGAGPRHIDYHPDKSIIYIMNELSGTVSVVRLEPDNTFMTLQAISTLPEGFSGNNKSADIHVHPNGKFLYASNRGDHNSVAVFSINADTGKLDLIEIETEAIQWPRNFAIHPAGKYLLVANKDDNSLTSYHIDAVSGALSFTGHKVSVPTPMCIRFLNKKEYPSGII